ncbi:MAG: helix-turn-helix transcriptional regulator [Actinomycetales bacterium]
MKPLNVKRAALLKTAEVGTLTGLAPAHLANMRSQGRGPRFVRLGAAVRYRREDVEAWIADHTVETSR